SGEPAPAVPVIVILMLSVVYIKKRTSTVAPSCAFIGARFTEVPEPVASISLGTGNCGICTWYTRRKDS
ncbi:hypothetical protein, partial [Pseudomonas grimontii]|uniref:hypothetical protein n=1 Tax=Pseudomonas grimontii TaxID=129847 RepID=UPI00387ABF49